MRAIALALRRRRPAIECVGLLTAVAIATAGGCWLSWQNLAEHRMRLGASAPADPSDRHRQVVPAAPHDRPARAATGADPATTPNRAAGRDGGGMTVTGHVLASGGAAMAVSAGAGAARCVLRRHRRRGIRRHGSAAPAEDATPERAPGDAPPEIDDEDSANSPAGGSTATDSPVATEPAHIGTDPPSAVAQATTAGKQPSAVLTSTALGAHPGEPDPSSRSGGATATGPARWEPHGEVAGAAVPLRGGNAGDGGSVFYRRRPQRVAHDHRALLAWGEDLCCDARTVNLSEGGVRCRIAPTRVGPSVIPRIGELLRISFPIGDTTLTLDARVQHRRQTEEETHLGLMFRSVAEADLARIRACLHG